MHAQEKLLDLAHCKWLLEFQVLGSSSSSRETRSRLLNDIIHLFFFLSLETSVISLSFWPFSLVSGKVSN